MSLSARLERVIAERYPYEETISEERVRAGLTGVLKDGVATQAMATLTTGPFLVAFALQMGGNNFAVGLLAAIPFFTQLFQLPAVSLVEAVRRRRGICVVGESASRFSLLVIAAAAFAPKGQTAVALLVLGLFLHSSFGAVAGCSWNSWMRDFLPQDRLGAIFARRLLLAAALSAVLSFAGGAFVDMWGRYLPLQRGYAYAILILVGAACGALGIKFVSTIPEPPLSASRSAGLLRMFRSPLADPNFRRLILFLGSWNLAVNLAAPFFTVFMLTTLQMDMTLVMAMSVVSLIPNVLIMSVWGRYADRFSNKTILAICGPMFIFAIFAWTFVVFPDPHRFTLPMLIAIHALMGIATAGVTLASGNIGLKLAPKGEATAYLAVLTLINALAAGVAPLLGGLFADFFAQRELALVVQWFSPAQSATVPILILRHWGFFFIFATLVGLFSLYRLKLVREEGEVEEHVVVQELMLEARRSVRSLSSVAGLRALASFPVLLLRSRREKLEKFARAHLVPQNSG